MRGFKAKTLRRLARAVTNMKHPDEVKGYKYQNPEVQRHLKVFVDLKGDSHPYYVSGTIIRADTERQLYQHMKRDLR